MTGSVKIVRDALDLEFWPNFLANDAATHLFDALYCETEWRQPELTIYGRRVRIPRLTAWYGDADATYVYSGLRNEPLPWTARLSALNRAIEDVTHGRFNSVLLNLYRNGNDHMSWHRDDEPELGPRPEIASVSLGAARRFDLRQVPRLRGASDKRARYGLELTHGSLLYMRGDTQTAWEHRIPRAGGLDKPRINLTFRTIVLGSPGSPTPGGGVGERTRGAQLRSDCWRRTVTVSTGRREWG